jgi:hypothetical protein
LIAAVVVSSTQRILPCCPYFVKIGGEGDSPEDINLTGEAKKNPETYFFIAHELYDLSK